MSIWEDTDSCSTHTDICLDELFIIFARFCVHLFMCLFCIKLHCFFSLLFPFANFAVHFSTRPALLPFSKSLHMRLHTVVLERSIYLHDVHLSTTSIRHFHWMCATNGFVPRAFYLSQFCVWFVFFFNSLLFGVCLCLTFVICFLNIIILTFVIASFSNIEK